MANKYEWKVNSNLDQKIISELEMTVVDEHPLKTPTVERIPRRVLGSQPSTGRTTPISAPLVMLDLSAVLEGIDPLTKFAIEEMDPLTQMATEMAAKELDPPHKKFNDKSKGTFHMEPWSSRKSAILSKFTTSEKLTLITSFLSDGDKVVVKAQSSAVDKVQHRLEQLDYFEEGSQHKLNVSQAEYIGRIEQLNKELVSAWNSEQRVKALKIVIQCAKLLSDTDVLPFYPSKFVLITDILDIFGQLVYDRLRTKSDYYKPGMKSSTALPEDFTTDIVPESTKETCRNWFYKIASIRELVPRIYVEMAILKSYSFLTSSEYSAALLRLTRMIRGIGNPLVALYARCYLCRVGITLGTLTSDNKYLIQNLYDFLDNYNQLFSNGIKQELKKQHIEYTSYLTLYTPGLDFILQAVAATGGDNLLPLCLRRCEQHANSALLLNSIMAAFKPMHVAQRSLQFLDLIARSPDEYFPSHILLRTLGLCISISPPPTEHRRQVLNLVWKQISNLNSPQFYISCVEAWIEYIVRYCTNKEVNQILEDVINHIYPNRAYEHLYSQLKQIIEKIVSHMQDFETLLSMDNFLPFLDLFQQENVKVEACKVIISSCISSQHTSDPVIINALMYTCSILHDSINALSVDDEVRQIGELLCMVVKKVDYGRDFEQQLSFYVEARGAFSNIDSVLAELVQCVNNLAVTRHKEVNGNHTRKTGAFVRACAAYCFITIPSIRSVKTRLDLYLLSGQVALFNHCLGQADACFKAALQIIPEVTQTVDKQSPKTYLFSYIRKFLSTLLVVPDSPDRGVLSLTRILLNTVQSYEWDVQNGTLCQLYLNVLDLLTAMSQDFYFYHVDKVESNDTLYGSDPKFISEINRMCSVVLNEILNQLKSIGHCRKQAALVVDLILNVAINADLNDAGMLNLISNLYGLLNNHEYKDKLYIGRCINYLKYKNKENHPVLTQLINKMKHLTV
ncbi:VPS35 endosomal protein-sorting factor-like [Onthophagus taurus]|uniref:VPS35 endosomal protein-sorting factor-like n=1 Tax=Onthophagus taurus TaxID=166361 RepID=UPI0039BE37C2